MDTLIQIQVAWELKKQDTAQMKSRHSWASNAGAIPGTGQGSSITKEAITAHGGSIIVDSEVGKGTSFMATIPLAQRERDCTETPTPNSERISAK